MLMVPRPSPYSICIPSSLSSYTTIEHCQILIYHQLISTGPKCYTDLLCQKIYRLNKVLCFLHADRIDGAGVIKVADFGLAEDIYSSGYFRQDKSGGSVKLPFKWMALESLQEGVFSEKSDVVYALFVKLYVHMQKETL